MGLQHTEIAPRSFLDALVPGYLGDPAVVVRLLARFLVDSETDLYALGAGRLDGAGFERAARTRILALARVFTGMEGGYGSIAGFHGISLPAQVSVALGRFWGKRREAWQDDPLAVLFEWLLLRLVAAWKTADGDDLVLQTLLKPDHQQVVDLLLGRSPRGGHLAAVA